MILENLRTWIDQRLGPWAKEKGLASLPAYAIEEPPAGIEADIACNLAMLLAKPLRQSPRAVAQEIIGLLSQGDGPVQDLTIAGSGFINFRWKMPELHGELQSLLKAGDHYGQAQAGQPRQKILIEFVSANPTGPLHVGHGRGAALGDSMAKILSHMGHVVTREYYINDAGNQVSLLGESVIARCRELQGQPFEMPAEGYHGDYVKEIAQEFLKQNANGTADQARDFALKKMLANIKTDLAAFGVEFDAWFSELDVVKKGLVEKYIELMSQKGHVEESEGAVWFIAPEGNVGAAGSPPVERDKNRVLKKKDGKWTYFATDIAYHADKYARGFERLIDVWGADHHGYVPRVKGSMAALGFDPGKLHVVLNQMVSLTRDGVPVAMSKRSGEFVTLKDLVDEVGRDACRFFFAMRSPNTAFDFDLELAKKHSNDNPVYYLQYAHARICSIFRQADGMPSPPDPLPAGEGGRRPGEGIPLHLLKEKEERDLIKRLSFFAQSLHVCSQEDSPHPLATYLLSLCKQFHHFYDHHRVLGDDPALTQARLALLRGVQQVLRLGLHLLGVSAPEAM